MRQSESIAALTKAKAAAQAEVENAIKGSSNPHFKSKYADLAAILEATRELYAKHGIAITQSPGLARLDGQWVVTMTTKLAHESGEWETGECGAPLQKADAQGVGSTITYLRRYSLAAFCGIAQEDDDGEGAVGRGKGAKKEKAEQRDAGPIGGIEEAKKFLEAAALRGRLDIAAREIAEGNPDLWMKVRSYASELKAKQ